VNDLKLSDSGSSQLRLLGAEVGARGILRSLSPAIERACCRIARAFGHEIPERIIAWNYMDLLDRDLSSVKLSVSHKTLDELHPADVADIIEQLDPRLRSQVFAQLDDEQAADAMAELDDDEMAARIMDGMEDVDASKMLSEMDPDDAAELVGELDYEKAEKLLRLMGVKEQRAIRQLLGYQDDTAGRIMTSEFVAIPEDATVADAIEHIRGLDEDFEAVRYVYLVDDQRRLAGVLTLQQLIVATPDTPLADMAEGDVITANPDDDQEDVADDISKYNLLAMPVVDEQRHILGIVTVDDALDVMEEEHEEDLQIAGSSSSDSSSGESTHELKRFLSHEMWFFCWIAASLVLVAVAGLPLGLLLSFALPSALLVADDMMRYVTNFFLEFDTDDEDAPSMAGFAFKGIGLALVYALLVLLISTGATNALMQPAASVGLDLTGMLKGFEASAITIVACFLTAPLYLAILRRRDDQNKETSGVALHLAALVVAAVVFSLVALLLSQGVVVAG
jgi:CBS domain-containing protein